MMLHNWLGDALDKAADKALQRISAQLNEELRRVTPLNLGSNWSFTNNPNVIDSTATVVNDDVKALPAPKDDV